MSAAAFSRIFIDRPILAAVLSIAILLAGLLAIPNLPVSEYPEVAPPTVQVTALYPGANPRVIAETVAAPLEDAIQGVENMIHMKSASASDGTLSLSISFRLGTDIDTAAMQVQNRVAQALPRLPEAVRALGVTTAKASPNITMVVNLTSPAGDHDALYLSNFAALNLRDELARIDGVGSVMVFGAGTYAMRIWIDPDRAAARGLTALDIVRAIRMQNVQVSAGSIGAAPQPEGNSVQLLVNASGRLDSPEEFGAIVLATGTDGALLRLRDVARIELGANTYAFGSMLDNHDSAGIVIFEAPGANTLELSRAIRERLTELQAGFPEGLEWSVSFDPTVFVEASIDAVIGTLLDAVLLVALVVVFFLQTWRSSIIPLLAVPVSIVGCFAVLLLLGYSINVLTLFGLVLAIGIVVDDAIVVVENVERHIEDGLAPRDAAYKAMGEVSGPIVAISLVMAAVFVPLALVDGVIGQFYQQFAVTIAAAVLISAFNSLTLSPALAALLLQPRHAPPDLLGRWLDRGLGWAMRPFQRFLQRSSLGYAGRLDHSIRRLPRRMVLYGGLLALCVFTFLQIPTGFIPTQDKQYLFAGVKLPEGASLERTSEAMRQMGRIALDTPGVASVTQFPGLNAVHFVATPNLGVMFIGLDPADELEQPAAAIAGTLTQAFAAIDDGLAFAFMPPPVFGYGNAAGVEAYVVDRGRLGHGELHAQTQALIASMSSQQGFGPGAAFTSFQAHVPQLDAVIDRDRVHQAGVALTDVFDSLQVYLGSAYVNDFNLFGRTWPVYVQADAAFRDDPADVARIEVRNAQGEAVPLGSLVDLVPSYGPDPVVRFNGAPAADFSATPFSTAVSADESVALVQRLAAAQLPQGMTLEFAGLTWQQVNQGMAQWLVFPLSVLLVFLVLAALFESWSQPLAVILIVPMCVLSALGGIWLLNTVHGLGFLAQMMLGWIDPLTAAPPTVIDMNVFTQIGLIVLVGLASKNAILIVEFARELERQGHGVVEAAIQASRLRLRPILMTSFTFIGGVLPLVFASGAGAEVRHVMGVTVFFGMLGVTFFGLFFTPLFYVALRRLESRFSEPQAAVREGGPVHG